MFQQVVQGMPPQGFLQAQPDPIPNTNTPHSEDAAPAVEGEAATEA